uniref:Fibronectin type-III domain-containing protein n=1 Tax=Panagrellus redivivus TaxID=6233 RepID=A0A7E4ZZ57_PANRE
MTAIFPRIASNPLRITLFIALLAGLITYGEANPSKRARCAIECYLKCVTSGTPKAVYCNCPIRDNVAQCDSVTEDYIKTKTTTTVPLVETSYKDVRNIYVRLVEPVPFAFIYVFEYSAISVEHEQWIFAGASSAPHITFTVPDPCRDYQFRVIAVLRSNDPSNELVAFLPRAIPVKLPAFNFSQEMIRLDQPKQSFDEETLHIFVSWPNPPGYSDADIYGYESPVAYPIRCMIPEDQLSQPKVEIIQHGARMQLSLPIDVLDEKCRIFLEVRAIPRCVRLDPFDIQASVELDCHKFPHLNYCKKEMSPQCAEIVDIWGEKDHAVVIWQPPVADRVPIYYQINHGIAMTQGGFPFVTRKILNHNELRVPGNQTKIDLIVQPGVQYGVQICAVFSEHQNSRSPFNIVPVIAFNCQPCAKRGSPNCVTCAKIEDTDNLVPVECRTRNCTETNFAPHFIAMNTAKMNVSSRSEPIVLNSNAVNPLQRHSKIVSTDIALPAPPSDDEAAPFALNDKLDLLFETGGTDEVTQETPPANLEVSTEATVPLESTEEPEITTESLIPTSTSTIASSTTTSTPSTTTESTTTTEQTTTTSTISRIPQSRTELPPQIVEVEQTLEEHITERTTMPLPTASPTTPLTVEDLKPPSKRPKADGIRLHPTHKPTPCKQRNGIVCEFGCLDESRCDCPKTEKSCIRGIHCPLVKDLRAVYDNATLSLKLYSKQIAAVLKNATQYDKIYLEFGEIGPAVAPVGRNLAFGSSGGGDFVFTKAEKERAVFALKKENASTSAIFDKVPYIMSVERPLRVGEVSYGLSVCALNSSLVPVIMDNVFMEQNSNSDSSISSFTQTLLSPVDLDQTEGSVGARRNVFLIIGPILLVFIVMLVVAAILCASIMRDRARTPSEKFRRRGILRDQSTTRFTGFRRALGVHNGAVGGAGGISAPYEQHHPETPRFYVRNVHF